jgi:hypothetical protein
MNVRIELASSNRSKCVFCGQPIEKGELRLAVVVAFTAVDLATTAHFYHLAHAAQSRPAELLAALSAFHGQAPGRKELEATAHATQRIIDDFVKSPQWERNVHGSLTLKGSKPVARVFSAEGGEFNWVVGDTFGKARGTEEEATRDLWVFLNTPAH